MAIIRLLVGLLAFRIRGTLADVGADTQTCINFAGSLSTACASGINAACCGALLNYNNEGCFCNVVLGVLAPSVAALKPAVAACGGALINMVGGVAGTCSSTVTTGPCGVPQYLVDGARVARFQTYAAEIQAPSGGTVKYDAISAYFTDTSEFYVPGTGRYVGTTDIVNYILVTDPAYNFGLTSYGPTTLQSARFFKDSQNRDAIDIYATQTYNFYNSNTFTEQTNSALAFDTCVTDTFAFRQVNVGPLAFEAFIEGVDHFENSTSICTRIDDVCRKKSKQYPSVKKCVEWLDSLNLVSPACEAAGLRLQGNSRSCRYLHHLLAVHYPDPHCVHAGYGGYDSVGKYKCNDQDCGATDPGPVFVN